LKTKAKVYQENPAFAGWKVLKSILSLPIPDTFVKKNLSFLQYLSQKTA